jgi:hypothetical protein
MYFDVLHIAIALVPLAIYLTLIGVLNLIGRPFVTTGVRDVGALAFAISGFAIIGPMELFFPESAAREIGNWVWLLMLTFYALCATLTILVMKPRLVIYNVHYERLRPILSEIIPKLDPDARWAGECLMLPNLEVQLHLEVSPLVRHAQLVGVGNRQSFEGWKRLEAELRLALKPHGTGRYLQGWVMTITGLAMSACLAWLVLRDPDAVAQAFRDWLRQ